jgi:hypothetical protein
MEQAKRAFATEVGTKAKASSSPPFDDTVRKDGADQPFID